MKVYYNSACPLCRAGIESERCRIEAVSPRAVEWIDVHMDPASVRGIAKDVEYVKERLHVATADGRLHVGVDAIAALLGEIPGQRWIARLIALPVIHGIGRVAYNVFARALYRWNRARGRW